MKIFKSKNKVILILCLLVITLTSGIVYASSPEQQAMAVADELFNNEVKGTCVEVWNTIGFNTAQEANESYLGDPIQIFLVENSISINKSLTDQTIAAPIYLFPIYANGRCVTEMEVKLCDGNWVLGRIGGHKAAYLSELANANTIKPSDLKLIRFGPFTAFVALKDGKEIGVTYQKDAKDFAMTTGKIASFKEKVKSFTDTVKVDSDNSSVILQGQSNNLEYSFNQNDSILQRIIRYINYLL